ncbi:hypothetical protein LYNGBM3L_02430 [Moorena producens 3L]|uniref:Uncharacterized protein n=1 Tax=Moorena producens 3L TaxID=489825 RepID=F4XRN0_9CYAN|nr:hypothetical protein LYNGBM3L_58780 [Moorena producens 3L]EGJ32746.1 hypothetical protein LYNGBM3L_02430 [Moorena producens 3L]
MEGQPLNQKCIKTFLETRHMRTAGLAGIVWVASVRPENPLRVEAVAMKHQTKS